MSNSRFSLSFLAEPKRLPKSIKDYETLLDSLSQNPYQGKELGEGVYKIRMVIVSKGKGKSGGARVLTYNIHKVNPEEYIIVLMSIYDKSEMENVSDGYLNAIIKKQRL